MIYGEAVMKQRILIADDDSKLVALLTSSLQKAGYATLEALDGEAALERVKNEKPDLVLADITMPKINGFELCKLIRADPVMMNIPFIFLTAKGELNDRVTGLNLGADDYISKPFHISEVTARIKVILQRSAPAPTKTEENGESDLKGNLEQMSLADIMQTLGMNKKTGQLKIIHQSRVGKIFFAAGNIVQAVLGKYKNEEAVYRILTWDAGYFEFDSDDRVGKTEITITTNSLLMEGFRQRDEYLKYTQAMPPLDSIVRQSNNNQAEDIKAAAQKILVLVDGNNTLEDIINLSPLNYLLTVKILYTLLKKGALEIVSNRLMPENEDADYGQLAQELYD
jgi:DNA-binding response OmpR family regulator